jgi:hypothetical protein
MTEDPVDTEWPATIAVLRDPQMQALHTYWLAKCGARAMPAREDIDPSEIKPPNRYRIRLVGTAVVDFLGREITGQMAGAHMPPDAERTMYRILDTVAETRAPVFRAGKAYWSSEKAFYDFEACFLPLSRDGRAVNLILSGVRPTLKADEKMQLPSRSPGYTPSGPWSPRARLANVGAFDESGPRPT